jgi:pimeloyl-ACP methyl ester carboxylesterase
MKDETHPPQVLFHRTFGHGPRKVLALHCTIAHSGAWRGLAGRMDEVATFLAPDMLSHGKSPDWDRQGDFQDRITEAVLPIVTEPMDVIGHSFGATVALRIAIAHPDLVRSLTMIEPVFFAAAIEDDPQAVSRHMAAAAPIWEAYASGDAALAARLFNRMWSSGGPRWPDLPEATRAAMTRGIHIVPACDAALFEDPARLLLPGRLEALTMPVQLLRGSETDPVIGVINDGLARRIPAAENNVVTGAGHMLPISHPAETGRHIRAIFARAPV